MGNSAMNDDVCLLVSQVAVHVSTQNGIVVVETLEKAQLAIAR